MTEILKPHLEFGLELYEDVWTAPFWAAARNHRLVMARCSSCARFRSPPTPFCPGCLSKAIEWVELTGDATLYAHTIVRHAVVPALAEQVPYVVAVVVLDGTDGTKFVSNVVNCSVDDVHNGMRLHVVWDDQADGNSIPRFGP
ncbi:MAG: hypothetical protein RI958_2204 [Actinomycetota bacterium]